MGEKDMEYFSDLLTENSFVNKNYQTNSAYADEYMIDENLKCLCNIDKNGNIVKNNPIEK